MFDFTASNPLSKLRRSYLSGSIITTRTVFIHPWDTRPCKNGENNNICYPKLLNRCRFPGGQYTNDKLQRELPQLKERRTLFQKELAEIKNFADSIMNKWASLASEESSLFLKDKLDQLGKRRMEIEAGMDGLEQMISEIEKESVNKELVMLALNKFTDVFDNIQPVHQKELLRLVLHKAILAPEGIKIALYGRPPEIGLPSLSESEIRSQTSVWHARQDSNLQPQA